MSNNVPSKELEFKTLILPRGKPDLPPLKLEMAEIYKAEGRLHEVSIVSPVTAPELMGYYNMVCNLTTKYISWIEYEILVAQKHFELAKSTVILDKMPDEVKRFKDSGMKANEDFRNALIARDPECSSTLDNLNQLIAVKALLENKARSFVRAYNASRSIWERRSGTPTPNFNGTIGAPASNLMGAPEEDY
ncbi:hypothetical protein EBU95_03840 [bacterium]|nr:hypothetical protein [bacterium]